MQSSSAMMLIMVQLSKKKRAHYKDNYLMHIIMIINNLETTAIHELGSLSMSGDSSGLPCYRLYSNYLVHAT